MYFNSDLNMNAAFSVKAINKTTKEIFCFDTISLIEGDTVNTLVQLLKTCNYFPYSTNVDMLIYRDTNMMFPIIDLDEHLIQNSTYFFSFKCFAKCYTKDEVDKFTKENSSNVAQDIVLILEAGTYFGQANVNCCLSNSEIVPDGFGRMLCNEYIYTGIWEDGIMKEGIVMSPKGVVYKGEFDIGGIVKGKEICSDNYTYEGDFENWLKHGSGKEYFPNGSTAEGIYIHGSFISGTVVWNTGVVDVGDFYIDDDENYILKSGTTTNKFGIVSYV